MEVGKNYWMLGARRGYTDLNLTSQPTNATVCCTPDSHNLECRKAETGEIFTCEVCYIHAAFCRTVRWTGSANRVGGQGRRTRSANRVGAKARQGARQKAQHKLGVSGALANQLGNLVYDQHVESRNSVYSRITRYHNSFGHDGKIFGTV